MKRPINFQKAVPLTIAILAGVIITLSIVWYGLDAWGWVVLSVFATGALAIGVDRFISWRKYRKK